MTEESNSKEVFKKEHVGMTVYSNTEGEGEIIGYSDISLPYKIRVRSKNGSRKAFTVSGRFFASDSYPSLSFKPWPGPPEGWDTPPAPFLEVDTLLWVKDHDCEEESPRYFAEWDKNGLPRCFYGGKTSKTACGISIT